MAEVEQGAGLLDAVVGVPGAGELADLDDLAGVVGVVGADMGDLGGDALELPVVGGFDDVLEGGEDPIELRDRGVPGAGVPFVEGLGVGAGEGGVLCTGELFELLPVPEEEMVGEHADGVVGWGRVAGAGGGGDKACLLGGEAGDGGVDGNEPVRLVVGGAELLEEDGAEGGGGLRLRWSLGEAGGEGEGESEKEGVWAHGGF